eukprot:222034-Pyramimonas_sp.AAC.2
MLWTHDGQEVNVRPRSLSQPCAEELIRRLALACNLSARCGISPIVIPEFSGLHSGEPSRIDTCSAYLCCFHIEVIEVLSQLFHGDMTQYFALSCFPGLCLTA